MKLMLMAIVAVLTMTVVSCGPATLADAVAEANKDCPKDMGDGMKWTGVELTATDLCYNMECDESQLSVGMMKFALSTAEGEKAFKQSILKSGDSSMEMLLDLCKKENKGIKIVFKGLKTGETAEIGIAANEI